MLAFFLLLFRQKPKAHHAPSVKISSHCSKGVQREPLPLPQTPTLSNSGYWSLPQKDQLHSCPFLALDFHPSWLPFHKLGSQARASSRVPCKLGSPASAAPFRPRRRDRECGHRAGKARQLLGCPAVSSAQAWSGPASPGQPRQTKLNHLDKNRSQN